MKLILRFLKPHWKLCLATIILLIMDVAGALFIPHPGGGDAQCRNLWRNL